MERLRNRFLKAGLAATMAFGMGTPMVRGVEVSPTPIVEPTPGIEPATPPEVEKLDVSPLVDYVNKHVNTDIDPKFFRRMEKRALNRPNEFFTQTEIPGGFVQLYSPEGLGTEVKVAYLHTVTNGVGTDYNGVPLGLNFFVTDNEIKLQLGEDGELASPSNINLFNFTQLERLASKDFKEPEQLRDIEWTRSQANSQYPAFTYKEFKDDTNHNILFANQMGFMALVNTVTEIPVVGTDAVPQPTPIK